jgi:hypothetical protein
VLARSVLCAELLEGFDQVVRHPAGGARQPQRVMRDRRHAASGALHRLVRSRSDRDPRCMPHLDRVLVAARGGCAGADVLLRRVDIGSGQAE